MRNSRQIQIGSVSIGAQSPIVVQSMCTEKIQNTETVLRQIITLAEAGAGIVRLAVDSKSDAAALAIVAHEIQRLNSSFRQKINLSVDLQENYRIAEQIAPFVQKLRYNPGHLHHTEKDISWREKVRWLVNLARNHDLALRIGVNCGSIDPRKKMEENPIFASAIEHAEWLEELGFARYCVSLKDSRPKNVVAINRLFAQKMPEVPIHLGVTEAGAPPRGIQKSRAALEPLLFEGIGDTLRISLTIPSDRKTEEVAAGLELIRDVSEGKKTDEFCLEENQSALDIISCPSCSRVQNARFVELAMRVQEETLYAREFPFTIAVMGCRVNGPGESDHADLGLWCGAECVNFKRRGELLGSFSYDEILPRLKAELDLLIEDWSDKNGIQSGTEES
ncbi:MAG: flavodoxin-dependent (E)-4-hydroxy-3-methylbut-2-enyl-diphosphate synthase [Planctomycetia bacterium]|nr:flavodoxin-dependent (E)-4-hydroxy-3-methylbut-2-enyl-diphosphate synthase [Planctomycetia bacterium]